MFVIRVLPPLAVVVSCVNLALAQESFLRGDLLRKTITGKTLTGENWSEYYAPDGTIHGKVRIFGVHNYVGKWRVLEDRVCYDYEEKSKNTCSQLRIVENQVFHHDLQGRLKNDGIARRANGNMLSIF